MTKRRSGTLKKVLSIPEGKKKTTVILEFIKDQRRTLFTLEACHCLSISCAGYYLVCHRESSNLKIENETLTELLKRIFIEDKGSTILEELNLSCNEYHLKINHRHIA